MTWRVDVPGDVVERAAAGDADAVETVVDAVRRPLYNLAVRFFWEPADAEDATQEALIRVVRGLPTFRGDSSFGTWCYRVAVNQFLTTRRRDAERLTLAEGAEALDEGLLRDRAVGPYDGPDAALLAEEVKLSCTTALLVCLSRPMRMAYILGDILCLAGPEAAEVLDITPAAFRKRLSLARRQVRGFLAPRCGLVSPDNPCACPRQVRHDLEIGWIDPDRLRFAGRGTARRVVADLDAAFDATEIFLSHPDYDPPAGLRAARALLDRVEAHAAAASRRSGEPLPARG